MPDDIWYYAAAGQQQGPVPQEQLRALIATGRVAASDLVWREGFTDWVPAATRPELLPPSPVPPTLGVPPLPHAGFATPTGYAPPPPGYPGSLNYYAASVSQSSYAGFWLRFLAVIIDAIILQAALSLFLCAGIAVIHPSTFTSPGNGTIAMYVGNEFPVPAGLNILMWLPHWLYYALMESSAKQATLGKLALGIKVVDYNNNRISFARATGRYFGKILSALILCVGFIMAGFTERKQALHDLLANTLVVRK